MPVVVTKPAGSNDTVRQCVTVTEPTQFSISGGHGATATVTRYGKKRATLSSGKPTFNVYTAGEYCFTIPGTCCKFVEIISDPILGTGGGGGPGGAGEGAGATTVLIGCVYEEDTGQKIVAKLGQVFEYTFVDENGTRLTERYLLNYDGTEVRPYTGPFSECLPSGPVGPSFPNCILHEDGSVTKVISVPQADCTHIHYDATDPGNAQELLVEYVVLPGDIVTWCECPVCEEKCTDVAICLSRPDPDPLVTEDEKILVLGELLIDGLCNETFADEVTLQDGTETTITALEADGWVVETHFEDKDLDGLCGCSGSCSCSASASTPATGAVDQMSSVSLPDLCANVDGTPRCVIPVVQINASTNQHAGVLYVDSLGNPIIGTVTPADDPCDCDCVSCP